MDFSELDPTIVSAIIVGIPTSVLAVITFFYMLETKRMRKAVQEPSFSLEPDTYVLGGSFLAVNLINTGGLGTRIKIDCSWGIDDFDSSENFYVLSLGKNGRSRLGSIPIGDIVQKQKKLKLEITCKDSKNKDYKTTLNVDFSKALADGRIMAYQYDPLSSISEELTDIKRNISRIK